MADLPGTKNTMSTDHKADGENGPPPYQAGLDNRTVHKECPVTRADLSGLGKKVFNSI